MEEDADFEENADFEEHADLEEDDDSEQDGAGKRIKNRRKLKCICTYLPICIEFHRFISMDRLKNIRFSTNFSSPIVFGPLSRLCPFKKSIPQKRQSHNTIMQDYTQ